MKFLSVLFVFLTLNHCSSQENMPITEINYEAVTRGSAIVINANEKELSYKDSHSERVIVLSTENWKSLQKLCAEFGLANLKNFKVLSDQRANDRALHATIKIIAEDTEFESQTFDHQNPPKELKKLVEKLFTLAEAEK